MRNINDFKFRGYDTRLEKMTYFDDEDYLLSYGQILRSKIEWDYNYAEKVGYEDVTNEIVLMQYAGLADKKGKEIYEGDIVKYRDSRGQHIEKVIFDKGCFYAGMHWGSSTRVAPKLINTRITEVIGNIYDNPELLGGE